MAAKFLPHSISVINLMSAKQSAEMREALRLVRQGTPIRQAAREAGVHWTSLHSALKKIKEAVLKQQENENATRNQTNSSQQ